MTYTLIGTGNMAHFLAQRLRQAGFTCKGVWGRNKEKASEVAAIAAAILITELNEIKDNADVCIIAVADDAISEISEALHLEKTTVIHTSGSQPLNSLKQPYKAVLWPIYSIIKETLPANEDFPVVCESNSDHAKKMVKNMATALSRQLIYATAYERKWMHLIAAMSNNFTNHILAICHTLCNEQDISFPLFLPIIMQTFERIKSLPPEEVQSGAARRNDLQTQTEHLQLLTNHPLWQELYREISHSIKDMYSSKDNKNIG